MRLRFYGLCLALLSACSLSSQGDNIMWNSVDLKYRLDDRWSLELRPIFRLSDDISQPQDLSWDLSVTRRFKNGLSVTFLDRYWIVFDGADRNFLWLDVKKSELLDHWPVRSTSRFRIHHAQNINGLKDPDFLRLDQKLTFPKGLARPFIALEIFYQLNKRNEVNRIRWQTGIDWHLSERSVLRTEIWREDFMFRDDLNIVALRFFQKLND